MKKLLIFPPGWSPVGPYLALPILKSYLKEKENIEVSIKDLNIEFYDKILSADYIEKALNNIEEKNLSESEKITLQLIKMSSLNVDRAKEVFRGEEYFDLEKRNYAENIIKNALFIISKSIEGSTIDLNQIQLLYDFKKTEEILRALDDSVHNPFVQFYKAEIIPYINSENIEFLGISISGSSQLISALTLCKLVKKFCKCVVHISLGGNYITRLAINNLSNNHPFYEFFDSIMLYDGEAVLPVLIRAIEQKKHLENINNLYYISNGVIQKNKIVGTDILNDTVPDFDGFAIEKYLMPELVLPIYTSRCCFNKCAFCTIPHATAGNYRTIPVEKVVHNVKVLSQRYKSKVFSFVDETFEAGRMIQFAELIVKENLEIFWHGETRFSKKLTNEGCSKIYASGCRQIQFGLESYNQRVLDKMKKHVKLEWINDNIENCLKNKVPVHLFFMVGFPTETQEEAIRTINYTTKILYDSKYKYGVPYSTRGFQEFGLDIGSDVWHYPEKYFVSNIDVLARGDLSTNADYDISCGLTQAESRDLVSESRFEEQIQQLFPEYIILPNRLHISEITWILDSINKVDYNKENLNKVNNINRYSEKTILVLNETVSFCRCYNEVAGFENKIVFYNPNNHYIFSISVEFEEEIQKLKQGILISDIKYSEELYYEISLMVYFGFVEALYDEAKVKRNVKDDYYILNSHFIKREKDNTIFLFNLITYNLCKVNKLALLLLEFFKKGDSLKKLKRSLCDNNIRIKEENLEEFISIMLDAKILLPF